VYVRVTDTDRSPGNRVLDTIFVDNMYIASSSGAAGRSSQAMAAKSAAAVDALPCWVPEGTEADVAVDGGSSPFDMEVAADPATADGIAQASAPTPDPQVLDDIFAAMKDDDEDGLVYEELLAALL
jgi:hypothetical protein